MSTLPPSRRLIATVCLLYFVASIIFVTFLFGDLGLCPSLSWSWSWENVEETSLKGIPSGLNLLDDLSAQATFSSS